MSRILHALLALGLVSNWLSAASPSFSQAIRPLLAEKCYACHGPDPETRKMGLRLDRVEDAISSGVIIPGDASRSFLIRKIRSDNPQTVMPPPASKKVLSHDQIQLLVDWIDAGADFEPHWAFQPIADPSPPSPHQGSPWIRDPIDAFVLSRLQQEGMAPAHQADPESLLRRVTLDLTGLVPTLEEMDAFLSDAGEEAYRRVVDRLLASPRYGEHMTSMWLDVARYADTFGYQNDRENHVWPWRDWVIDAFNRNLPYDDFVTQQLAGDLLPDPTPEQRLATAFNRLHRQTNEGGSVEEEFRLEYVADRTETFGTAFLGLTLECARCHDHKFDPVSQKEFYQVSSFFASIDESGMYSHFTETAPTPAMPLFEEGQQDELARLQAHTRRARDAWQAARLAAADRYQAWRKNGLRSVGTRSPVVHLGFDRLPVEKTLTNLADPEHSATVPDAYAIGEGVQGRAVLFDGDNGIKLQEVADFDRFDPFSLSLWIRPGAQAPAMVVCHRSRASLDAASRGYELLLEEGKLTFGLTHFWPGNALRLQSLEPLRTDVWSHVALTYDGSSRARGVTLFVNGHPVPVRTIRDTLAGTVLYGADSKVALTLGARFRDTGFTGGLMDEFRVYDAQLSALEVRALATPGGPADLLGQGHKAMDAPLDGLLKDHYVDVLDPEVRTARARLNSARAGQARFFDAVPQIMVMEEMPEQRATYLLERGDYRRPGERVYPETPALLGPFPDGAPRNRLGLARWLFGEDNPLTARVAVNRLWQQLFGRGLVSTSEDFGVQGDPPLHGALLDYLAARYRKIGWDTKALLREMVLSSTYRQSSRVDAGRIEADPENLYLGRGPRHRLSAESIRDAALAASGLLSERIGGPSVKPYQPDGLWKDSSQISYQPDSGDALYRRSMYTYLKRTVPPPSMLIFDATNRETCVVNRERTQTPLQALVLLNDPQFVEASRVLAQRTLEVPETTVESALRTLFKVLTSRRPDPAQMEVLLQAHAEQWHWFKERPRQAAAYLKVGEFPANPDLDPVQLAACTAVAQMVMNFDPFQMKQ